MSRLDALMRDKTPDCKCSECAPEPDACDYVEQRRATWTQPAEAYGCELPAVRGGRCARHADTPEREREHDDD